MSARSTAFRVKSEEVRRKIGKSDPRLNPVWDNIARSFELLAETIEQCERPISFVFDYD